MVKNLSKLTLRRFILKFLAGDAANTALGKPLLSILFAKYTGKRVLDYKISNAAVISRQHRLVNTIDKNNRQLRLVQSYLCLVVRKQLPYHWVARQNLCICTHTHTQTSSSDMQPQINQTYGRGTVVTRHRASTSMYWLTFCVRVMSAERQHWKPTVQAAAVMLRTPPSPAGHQSATRAHPA